MIRQHEAVSEAAVIGIADEKWGERPPAPVDPKKEWRGKLDGNAVRNYFNKAAARGWIPRHGVCDRVVFVDAVAKTSVGKIDK